MKKILLILFIGIYWLVPGQLFAAPSLWKIETEQSLIYLFGSIHVGTKEMYPLDAEIEQAYKNSSSLVVEVDIAGSAALKATGWLMLNSSNNGTVLDNLLTTKSLNLLKIILKKHNLPYAGVKYLKPWVVAMQLVSLELITNEITPQWGVDLHFLMNAHQKHKNIIELESISEQFNLFDDMSMEKQIKFLTESLEQMKGSPDEVKELLNAWQDGNESLLNKLMLSPMMKDMTEGSLYDLLLKQRNIRMADKINDLISQGGSYFIVVGAAHYLGNDSIIRYLKTKGIKISQVQ